MQSLFLLLFGLAILGACIWFLHRIQLRRTVENADLTAPLDALGDSSLPDFAGAVAKVSQPDTVPAPAAVHEVVADASRPVLSAEDENPPAPASASAPAPASDTASASAPAPASDTASVSELITSIPRPSAEFAAGPVPAPNDWLAQIRSLREGGQLDAALALSRTHFPKTQAFQQAAIILRQQIREALEQFQPADALLHELYNTAALADLFRTSSSHKPHDSQAALAAVRTRTFTYAELGHARLKLLNKSDVRALEQLWGAPPVHRHTEDMLGEDWLAWCRAP